MSTQFRVLTWNVFEKHKPSDVDAALTQWVIRYMPDVIVLQEAKNLYGKLSIPGYRILQAKPKARKRGRASESANIAILVRGDLKVSKWLPLIMAKVWRGPKAGILHDPRTYRWIIVTKGAKAWKVGGFHFPYPREAQGESAKAVRNWFKRTVRGRATIAVGDWNLPATKTRAQIAKPIGASVAGTSIDHAIYRNCRSGGCIVIGKHGSDHSAKMFLFSK